MNAEESSAPRYDGNDVDHDDSECGRIWQTHVVNTSAGPGRLDQGRGS